MRRKRIAFHSVASVNTNVRARGLLSALTAPLSRTSSDPARAYEHCSLHVDITRVRLPTRCSRWRTTADTLVLLHISPSPQLKTMCESKCELCLLKAAIEPGDYVQPLMQIVALLSATINDTGTMVM